MMFFQVLNRMHNNHDSFSQIKSSVTWKRLAWPSRDKTLYTIHEDLYAQIVDANCGAYCGMCEPEGPLYLDVVVPHANFLEFGEKNLSFIDNSDQEIWERKFDLSRGGLRAQRLCPVQTSDFSVTRSLARVHGQQFLKGFICL